MDEEYNADIENVYLCVVNDVNAASYAHNLIKQIKHGFWSNNIGNNRSLPLNRRRPARPELNQLARIAGATGSWGSIHGEKMMYTLWHKIVYHIDEEWFDGIRNEPTLQELQTEIVNHLTDATAHFQAVADGLNPTKEKPMTKLLETITYIKGNDVKKMSEEDLVNAIKTLENEIADLNSIKTPSKKLDKRKNEIEDALKVVVTELDSRD